MIDPETIRRQLERVWEGLGQKPEGRAGVLRACSLTLIAVVEEDGSAGAIAETLAELMPEHPCRAIVLRLSPGAADFLEASVEAQCWLAFGQRQQICSEQIVIRCSEKTLVETPSAILPLLVADLPVVVWCPSRRVWESDVFPALAEPADRILFDTSRADRSAKALRAVAAARRRGRALVADLAWTHLTRWRALLAQVFENELYRQELRRLSEVTISFGGEGDGVPSTALLMAGWLISRLPGADGARFQPVSAGGLSGRLTGVALASRTGAPARVIIRRTGEDCGEVRAEVGGLEPVMNRVALAPSTDAALLSEELKIHAGDPIFEESLAAALCLAGTASL